MEYQNDINEKMRRILIDWLIDVHLKFKLVLETIYLTVNLIDHYLEIVRIKRIILQLIGVTSLLIAFKCEEICPPDVKYFTRIIDNAYNKEELFQMEKYFKNFKF